MFITAGAGGSKIISIYLGDLELAHKVLPGGKRKLYVYVKEHQGRRPEDPGHDAPIHGRHLTILLDTTESWTMGGKAYLSLRRVYRAHVRQMCRVSMRDRIRTTALLGWLNLPTFRKLVDTQLLNWYGQDDSPGWSCTGYHANCCSGG